MDSLDSGFFAITCFVTVVHIAVIGHWLSRSLVFHGSADWPVIQTSMTLMGSYIPLGSSLPVPLSLLPDRYSFFLRAPYHSTTPRSTTSNSDTYTPCKRPRPTSGSSSSSTRALLNSKKSAGGYSRSSAHPSSFLDNLIYISPWDVWVPFTPFLAGAARSPPVVVKR